MVTAGLMPHALAVRFRPPQPNGFYKAFRD